MCSFFVFVSRCIKNFCIDGLVAVGPIMRVNEDRSLPVSVMFHAWTIAIFTVVCSDAVESFSDKPTFSIIYNSSLGCPLSAVDLPAFT